MAASRGIVPAVRTRALAPHVLNQEAEYLIRGHDVPLSLFARGDFGNEDYTSITGGLKVYLSGDPQKSLIDRHRRDDPENYVPAFPTRLATKAQCSLKTSGFPPYVITGPADGQCICPSGSPLAGKPPVLRSLGYICASAS
jgi:hypothetical protein